MVRSTLRHAGGQLRLVIDRPVGNILTTDTIDDVRRALLQVADSTSIKLVTLEGAGDHFSYGASVEEHRPGAISNTLRALHDLVREMLALPAPTAAIVRGCCLGGGFELALACDFIFAGTNAMLGLPEINLGVFPPAGAALLPSRVGASRTASAILTGKPRTAVEWAESGLIELTAPPEAIEAAVDEWFEANLAHHSAAALGFAALASRQTIRGHVSAAMAELERLYLDDLMNTHDAIEGIEAFLERRQPAWSDS